MIWPRVSTKLEIVLIGFAVRNQKLKEIHMKGKIFSPNLDHCSVQSQLSLHFLSCKKPTGDRHTVRAGKVKFSISSFSSFKLGELVKLQASCKEF